MKSGWAIWRIRADTGTSWRDDDFDDVSANLSMDKGKGALIVDGMWYANADVVSLAAELWPIGGIALIIVACVYVWRRTGSAHFMLARLWLLITGQREFHDTAINRVWRESRDVDLFRYMTGVRFRSLFQVKKAVAFMDEHNIYLGEMARLSHYYDPDMAALRNPGVKKKKLLAISAFPFLCLVFVFGFLGLWLNDAAFVVKESGVYFFTDAKSVSAFVDGRWWPAEVDCEDRHLSWSANDYSVMCSMLEGNEDIAQHIERVVWKQKLMGLFLVIFFCVMIGFFSSHVQVAKDVERMRNNGV